MKIAKSQLKQIVKEEFMRLVEGDVIQFPTGKKPTASIPPGEELESGALDRQAAGPSDGKKWAVISMGMRAPYKPWDDLDRRSRSQLQASTLENSEVRRAFEEAYKETMRQKDIADAAHQARKDIARAFYSLLG